MAFDWLSFHHMILSSTFITFDSFAAGAAALLISTFLSGEEAYKSKISIKCHAIPSLAAG